MLVSTTYISERLNSFKFALWAMNISLQARKKFRPPNIGSQPAKHFMEYDSTEIICHL